VLRSSSRRARLTGGLALLAAGLLLAACGQTPQSIIYPAGPVAAIQEQTVWLGFWIMTGIAVVVFGLILYSIIRFRARGGATEGEPAQIEGNHVLELTWTVVPIILLAVLAVPTVKGAFASAVPPPSSDALHVKVVGHQWWWEFDYPDLGIVTATEMHIPVGRPVVLQVEASDVLHGFWVPRLAGKIDAIPGRSNTMWLEASQPGDYSGQCAEYCGTSHALMRFRVVASSPADFDAWVQKMQHPANTQPQTGLAAEGYKVFSAVGCSACHTVDGTGFKGTVGPNLTNLGLRTTVASGILPNDDQGLAAWLANPQAVMPANDMPNLHLSQDQIRALIAYLDGMK
jgi:cytochrome c oxidase subunit 2